VAVSWTRLADRDLVAAHGYISRDNPDAAVEAIRRVETAIGRLARFPNMGRPGRAEGTRELVVAGTPFVVVYAVKGADVLILRVLHGAQDRPEAD
jgi:toxin ParE1/3/4